MTACAGLLHVNTRVIIYVHDVRILPGNKLHRRSFVFNIRRKKKWKKITVLMNSCCPTYNNNIERLVRESSSAVDPHE